MKFNMKKNIVAFFILIVTLVVASEQKIPNVTILDNPTKEVTTIEGLKNREASEVNIKVKKRNIEKLEGIEVSDSLVFSLPKGSLTKNEEIKVVKSLEDIPTSIKDKRRKRNVSLSETSVTIEDIDGEKIIKIPKEEGQTTNYILILNKNTKEIGKVFKGEFTKNNSATRAADQYLSDHYIISRGIASTFSRDHIFPPYRRTWLNGAYWRGNSVRSIDDYRIMTDPKINFPIYGLAYMYDTHTGAIRRYYNRVNEQGYTASDDAASGVPSHGFRYFYRRENGNTDLYGALYITVRHWESKLGINSTTSSDVGVYQILSDINLTFDKTNYNFNYVQNLIIKEPNPISLNASINEVEIGKKIPIILSSPQKLSFYKSSNKDGIKIYKDGNKISTDGSASFNINGNEFDILFEQVVGESAKPYIIIKKYVSPIDLPLIVESWYTYSDINAKLITFNLNLKIGKAIGEVKFQVDKRLQDSPAGSWIKANGDLNNKVDGSPHNTYPNLINLNGNFTNLESTTISDVISIEGRPNKIVSSGYRAFITAPGVWKDESAMPINVNLNILKDNLVISKDNSSNGEMLNNKFILKGANNALYSGNVKEVYLGESAAEAVGTLDLSNITLEWTGWNTSGGTGDISSTHGTRSVMKLTSGKLFNWKSAISPTGKHIVTKLKVTNRGIEDIITASDIDKKLITTKFSKNRIGIDGNGFFIHKDKESSTPEVYEIEIYNKDILLGKLTLTITNKIIKDIGEVEFQVDKRLQNSSAGSWIKANGDLNNKVDGSPHNTYPNLINLNGNFTNLESTTISDVISIEGRPNKIVSSGYRAFITAPGVWKDESAMPINVNLNILKDNLVISKDNSSNGEMLNNKFILKGANNALYSGNVKEVYLGESAAEAVGTLDLSNITLEWTGWNTSGGTGDISSTHGTRSVMKLTSGKLFNWKSAISPTGKHIVTKLKVTNRGIEDIITASDIDKKLITTKFSKNRIGIDGNGFFIHKDKESSTPEVYEIEIYNKDILLGKLTLTIKNADVAFEILGDDIIDFGVLIQGQNKTIDGNLIIKNLNSRKILNVELNGNKPIKILKKGDSSIELPIVGSVSLLKRDIEVPIKVNLTATPEINQPIGDYEGEINLYIYIE